MNKLILIKLGGSVITDKGKPFTARRSVINKLVKEIKIAKNKLDKNTLFLIGHGGGSFPHVPAAKYLTHRGLINKNSLRGLSLTADAAIQINRIVVEEFLKEKIDVLSFSPLSFIYSNNEQTSNVLLIGIKRCFDIGITPIIYGDVIMDKTKGFCIFSAEKTLSILARKLRKDYKIEKLIEVGDTDGVYDLKGKTIPEVNSKNFKDIKKYIRGSKSTDVTGGMIHKVEESLKLAKKTKIKTLLINGKRKESLLNAIINQSHSGSWVLS